MRGHRIVQTVLLCGTAQSRVLFFVVVLQVLQSKLLNGNKFKIHDVALFVCLFVYVCVCVCVCRYADIIGEEMATVRRTEDSLARMKKTKQGVLVICARLYGVT